MARQKVLDLCTWFAGTLVVGILPFFLIWLANAGASASYEGKIIDGINSLDPYYSYQFILSSFVAIGFTILLNLLPIRDRSKLLIVLIGASISMILLTLNIKVPFVAGLIFSKSSGIYGLTTYIFLGVVILVATKNTLRFNHFLSILYIFIGILIYQLSGLILQSNLFQSSNYPFVLTLSFISVGIAVFIASILELLHWEFFSKGEVE